MLSQNGFSTFICQFVSSQSIFSSSGKDILVILIGLEGESIKFVSNEIFFPNFPLKGDTSSSKFSSSSEERMLLDFVSTLSHFLGVDLS